MERDRSVLGMTDSGMKSTGASREKIIETAGNWCNKKQRKRNFM
jgi:hypothetical protein